MADPKSDTKTAGQQQGQASQGVGLNIDLEDLIALAVAQVVTKSGKKANIRRSNLR
jgi:hypothetical protein